MLTNSSDDSDRYGLGHVRKLCDFESRLGVSFESRKILRNVDVTACHSNETFDVTDVVDSNSSGGVVVSGLSSSDKLDILRKLNISV